MYCINFVAGRGFRQVQHQVRINHPSATLRLISVFLRYEIDFIRR